MVFYKEGLEKVLKNEIIPFWLDRSIDSEYGGYITSFDSNGVFSGDYVKNIVTQSRMIWGFSALRKFASTPDKTRMETAARQGVDFLLDKFWDKEYGGFYWLLNREGNVLDSAKLTYGEGFAIYALAQYYLEYKDKTALDYAEKCFEYLEVFVSDNLYGGYYENVERDWSLSSYGKGCGDRKSLDIHMHLLEAFTILAKATGKEIHRKRLKEVYKLILRHMVNREEGYGYNQFDLAFNKIPAINIPRTWNAERKSNETIEIPTDTTSYGHNVELSWLADFALGVLGDRTDEDNSLLLHLLDHAIAHGIDKEYGGIYRDGVASGNALVLDKEWWQNFEAMTGFINGYCLSGKAIYLDTFKKQYDFVMKYFMEHEVGESRQLLSRDGSPLISDLGNRWKGIYHTGRALAECIERLDRCPEYRCSK